MYDRNQIKSQTWYRRSLVLHCSHSSSSSFPFLPRIIHCRRNLIRRRLQNPPVKVFRLCVRCIHGLLQLRFVLKLTSSMIDQTRDLSRVALVRMVRMVSDLAGFAAVYMDHRLHGFEIGYHLCKTLGERRLRRNKCWKEKRLIFFFLSKNANFDFSKKKTMSIYKERFTKKKRKYYVVSFFISWAAKNGNWS